MLTGEEQWKILQELERRNGREKRREKTLAEQLVEMGGFGKDPDSEQAIMEELERDDTRAPLQCYQRSVSECEALFGKSSFWESRKRLFRSWIFQAKRSRSWIQEKDLPLFFRFALGRPIMNEWVFRSILKAMKLQLDESTGNARQPHTHPLGRGRQLLFGIDVNPAKDVHPSHKYRDVLSRGAAEDADGAREEARRIVQRDDKDMQELLRSQLWAVHEHVQDGSVPLETAAWHYRDAFNKPDMSDETLVLCLQQFGIPTDHISNNGRSSPQGNARCQSPSTWESESVAEIRRYVGLYRNGVLLKVEAVQMIQHRLVGLKMKSHDIGDSLTDLKKGEEMAALQIWEDACEDEDYVSSSSSSSSSSSEDEDEEPYEDHKNYLRATMVPDPHANDEKDENAAVGLPVDEIKPSGRITTEYADNGDGFNDKESHKSEAIMGPPSMPSGKLSVHSHADRAGSSTLLPGTPRPASVLSVTETFESQGDAALDREPPGDRAQIGHRKTSFPDEGMTTGIWGLLMPTKEARNFAYELKLPQNVINDQVRSISPRKERRRRESHLDNVVLLPRSKRKASLVLHKGTASKFPKHNDYSDIFAREGEDSETFVLSHFDRAKLPSVPVCDKCLCLPCECGYESAQVDEATQAASCEGSLSSDGYVTTSIDRTRAEPPKKSVTVLAYLARVLDDNDVLASIKQLEQQPETFETFAYVKMARDHIQQGISAGEELVVASMEDREVVRILRDVIRSLHRSTLVNYSKRFRHEIKEEDNSVINDNDYRDEVQESPDPSLSLLNSSLDHEHAHAPPSDDISSAAASPETQSKVANNPLFQANSTPLAKYASPYLPTATPPDSSVLHLKSNSGIEDAAQPSRFQTATAPDSSTAGDSSRSENLSRSPGGCKNSPAGGHSSQTKFPPESPAESTLSPTADLSEQVSDNPVGAVGDTDNTFRAPFTEQPHSNLQGKCSSDGEMPLSPPLSPAAGNFDDNVSPLSSKATAKQSNDNIPPPSPRPPFKQLPNDVLSATSESGSRAMSIPPPSPRPPFKQLPKDVPSATLGLGSRAKSRERKATYRSDPSNPGSENPPLRPPQSGLPGKDGYEWMGMSSTQALDHAKKKAFSERKSLAFYLEERRAVRNRIQRENDLANSEWSDHSFFQTSNGLSGSSGTVNTQALNKLFDKYRGISNVYLRSRTQPC